MPLAGFDGSGQFDLAVGVVHGYRAWTLPTRRVHLKGAYGGYWEPGLNESRCARNTRHRPPAPPPCGCGFWAYWDYPRAGAAGRSGTQVNGVIEGSGRTLIGELGFRCQQARIIALHVPVDSLLIPALDRVWQRRERSGGRLQVGSVVLEPGGVAVYRALGGTPGMSAQEREQIVMLTAREAEAEAARVQAELMVTYPEAEVFASLAYMLMKYPPEGRP